MFCSYSDNTLKLDYSTIVFLHITDNKKEAFYNRIVPIVLLRAISRA